MSRDENSANNRLREISNLSAVNSAGYLQKTNLMLKYLVKGIYVIFSRCTICTGCKFKTLENTHMTYPNYNVKS